MFDLPTLAEAGAMDYESLGAVLKQAGVSPLPRDKSGRLGAVIALVSVASKPVREAGADATSETAVAVDEGVSADVSLTPETVSTDDRAQLIEDVARIRQIRKPFGAATQKLAIPQRPGYHRHWFNDEAGRVDEAKASGWSHIKGRDGQPIRRAVGTGRDNGVLRAYAMELPEVFWQEDMAARHAEAQARMDSVKKSPAQAKPGQAKPSDKGKFYSPNDEAPISIITK
jgi:hypothetical protein